MKTNRFIKAAAAALLAFGLAAVPTADIPLFQGFGITASAAAPIATGKCDNDLTWYIDETGRFCMYSEYDSLIAMPSFDVDERPWKNYLNDIKTVDMGPTMRSISDNAFYGCTSLEAVTDFGCAVTIGKNAFGNCTSLTTLTFNSSLVSIGDGAFDGCNALSTVTYKGSDVPWQSVNIGSGNDSIKNIPILTPSGTINTGSGNCGKVKETDVTWRLDNSGDLTISGSGAMKDYDIYDSADKLSPWASYNKDILNVVINDGVTSIGEGAFEGCSYLKSVTISAGVTDIGDYAFCGCNSLKSITIPASVISIGESAFEGCSYLKSVTISAGVTSIGDYAFCGCNSLGSITIPASVTDIGDHAFYGCKSLGSVTIPASVTGIGEHAFDNCTSLGTVTFSEGLKTIGNSAFYNCSITAPVTIPASVISIGKGTFVGNGFTQITFKGDPEIITSGYSNDNITTLGYQYNKKVKLIAEGSTINLMTYLNSLGSNAAWEKYYTLELSEYTVTYKYNDGKTADTTAATASDGTVTLPVPARKDYKFDGWFRTADLSGTAVTADTVYTENTTLYAKWTLCDHSENTAEDDGDCLTAVVCSVCGGNAVEARSAHTYDDDHDTVCNAEGCTAGSREPIHTYGTEWQSDSTSHWYECSCGDKTDTEAHIKDGGTVTTEPTESSTGVRTYSCTVCGYEMDTEEIPALPSADPTVAFVDRLYDKFFGRVPSDSEKQNHIEIVKTMTAADDVRNFIYAPEFTNRNVSDAEFVNIMYNVFFDRDAGNEGDGWVKALENGCSRDRVFYGFIGAGEFAQRCSEAGIQVGTVELNENRDKNPEVTAFVAQLYRQALGRDYDIGGMNAWTGAVLDRETDLSGLAHSFIFSPEFTQTYTTNEQIVEQLYRAMFGREADEGGKASWLAAMDAGATKEDVFDGFIGSLECNNYFNSFGI